VFETSADNIGFRLARGKFLVEVQADMQVTTFGFNYLLSAPCRAFADVFAVSGRGAHNFNGQRGVGKLEDAVEARVPPFGNDWGAVGAVCLTETVNRGPLVLRRDDAAALGFLDEANFVLGDDEHDLMARAHASRNLRSAYVPVEFHSPLARGTTRKPRSAVDEAVLRERLARSSGGALAALNVLNGVPGLGEDVRYIPGWQVRAAGAGEKAAYEATEAARKAAADAAPGGAADASLLQQTALEFAQIVAHARQGAKP
jgi:hypothetical protein